ncbi:MAG: hypothetical protein HUJ54_02835 [Erysipelotrichaceae bacterium]|nr:hypothetical protein [Erysipelotrichaceae bacterium]
MFHGSEIKPSANKYDWLGEGIYFWENNLERAKEWARDHHNGEEYIIGAVIDLGYCLDLTDDQYTPTVAQSYNFLKSVAELSGFELPKNKKSKNGYDCFDRQLDCHVINFLHKFMKDAGFDTFDSVRGPFFEGGPLFEGSELSKKTHIQVAVLNPNCIKGYFIPRELNSDYPRV